MIRTQKSVTIQKLTEQSALHSAMQVVRVSAENRLGKRLPAIIGSAFINVAKISDWCGGVAFNFSSILSGESTDYQNRPEPNNPIRSGECRHLTALPI